MAHQCTGHPNHRVDTVLSTNPYSRRTSQIRWIAVTWYAGGDVYDSDQSLPLVGFDHHTEFDCTFTGAHLAQVEHDAY